MGAPAGTLRRPARPSAGDAATAITMDNVQQVRRLDITQRHEQTLAIFQPHRDNLKHRDTITT